jgi:two-component system OmpR family response regulator
VTEEIGPPESAFRFLSARSQLISAILAVRKATMRILIVEDEVKIARALQRGLEQEAYAVDVQYDGRAGLRYAVSEPYDLIVLDRMLPGLDDGLEICAAVRKRGLMIPVLVLTARDGVKDRVAGLDTGADDYLVKPFAFEEFLARVRALLRRPPVATTPVFTVGDVSLDPAAFTVSRQSQPVVLTRREFALLEYLMRQAGRTVTKDDIIAHVWDYDADILPNTVEAYVGYLRNKLEKPFGGAPFIQTVRGFGYRIPKN